MVKTKKSLLLVLVMMLVLSIGMALLVACDSNNTNADSKEYTVTFKIRENGTGDWKEHAVVKTNAEGKLELPAEPVVDGYSFRGWFLDEACTSGKEFDKDAITADVVVYGHLSDKILTVNIKKSVTDNVQLTEQAVANLATIEAEQKTAATAANLTFDGWYTNEACTVAYSAESGATTIYGRYVAVVSFDNGYEKVGNDIKVVPGDKIEMPKVEDIQKPYMAADDIFYVKENGEDYAFDTDTFSVNTTIKVLWKSPLLGFRAYNDVPGKVEWYGLDNHATQDDVDVLAGYPVVSIPSRVSMPSKEDPKVMEIKEVVAADCYGLGYFKGAKKVIFQDGIKAIDELTGPIMGETAIEEVVLPNDLVVLERSFNNFGVGEKCTLKGITLPETLEVITDCFWSDYVDGYDLSPARGNSYAFDINIPANVKTVSIIPASVKFAEGSPFVADVENNRVYKVDGANKTLVSEVQANVKDGVLNVADDVTMLQVGVFKDLEYDYLNIPASFKAVSYNTNENVANYAEFYFGNFFTDMSIIDNPTSKRYWNPDAYSVVSDLDAHKYVVFDTVAYPEGVSNYAFVNSKHKPHNELEEPKVAYKAVVTEGQITVNISYNNTKLPEYSGFVAKQYDVNTTIDKAMIAELIATEVKQKVELVNIVKASDMGKEFVEGNKNTNLYINIDYDFVYTGVTTEAIGDTNTLKVTGFDKATCFPDKGTYKIAIPDEINGKKVVEVAANAFNKNDADYSKISQVYIGKNVAKVGDYAFANLSNLDKVTFADGGEISVIGAHAFEYAGALQNSVSKKYYANPSLPLVANYSSSKNNKLPTLLVELPLAKITSIGEAAFNSPAIRTFNPVASEKDKRPTFGPFGPMGTEELVLNGYYYKMMNNEPIGIVKYVGDRAIKLNKEDKKLCVTEYYATAAGFNDSGSSLGFGSKSFFGGYDAVSTSVMSGSVYLYNVGFNEIVFAHMDKVEKNAFYYLADDFFDINTVGRNRISAMSADAISNFDLWYTRDAIIADATSAYAEGHVFADGWFMNRDNTTNTFMKSMGEFSGNFPGM